MKKLLIPAALGCILALGACTKKKTTTCTPSLYGYSVSGLPWSTIGPSASATFGNINMATMTSSSAGAVSTSLYTNQATFNTSDNCYYVFQYDNSDYTAKLHKITLGGTVTTYTNAGGTQQTTGLIYNPVTNKFYCLTTGTTSSIAEVTITGSSYIVTTVASTTGSSDWASPGCSSIDAATGDMYFSLLKISPNNYSIEKYHPGATATTVVTSGSGAGFLGLRFNANDNMIYAIKDPLTGGSGCQFVKIAAGGSITSLATLSFPVNNEFYSTVIDRCNNRYILSTLTGSPWSTNVVVQLDMSGAIIKTDTTAGLYQGLDILY